MHVTPVAAPLPGHACGPAGGVEYNARDTHAQGLGIWDLEVVLLVVRLES